ncbi:transcriptional regulator [Pleosporales sp. CAS-2024a]
MLVHTGPGTQALRTVPPNMFQTQQNANRGGPLGANRLPNGKMGGASQWAFGGALGGAPGLANTQTRPNGGPMSSFAQAMSGSQPHTPLNLEELRHSSIALVVEQGKLNVGTHREFPSLSGAPQAQQNTSAQQMWANPTLRTAAQQQTIGRPQGQGPQQGQSVQNANQQLQNQGQDDSSQSQFSAPGDDYRFGGQGGVGQLSGGAQPQTTNIEDFPPLGGGAGEIGPDRRAGLIQNAAAFGGSANLGAFPGLGQTRNGLSSPTDSQQDRILNPTVGGRGLRGGASRTPFENLHSTPTSLQDSSQMSGPSPGNMGFLGPQIGRTDLGTLGQRPQQSQFDQTFGADNSNSAPNTQIPLHKKLADMSGTERYGLPGLLSMIPLESPDYSSLAMGQDLTVLGLDLSRPDNSPLHPTFGSPFEEATAKPVIPPDFTLPAAYTVTNVPPLHSKMNSFTPDTLLAIFYQFPRDILQELAAQELYNRDWRWHTEQKQWMMKDPDLPPPVRITPTQERGWYIFFDVNNWRRERREFELNYDHLDQRHGSPAMGV